MTDPAFLFYSKDFYEGTRTMLPKERACLVDLMIYQHQHGPIPNDLERITMYCSGIDEATLKSVLETKFRKTDEGWVNLKMNYVTENRETYRQGQSVNGKIGQFWKKTKALVTAKELKELKSIVYDVIGKEVFAERLNDENATLEGLLEGLRKHIANANAIIYIEPITKEDHALVKWVKENAPSVAKMKQPLTNDEAKRLIKDLEINTPEKRQELKDVIIAMDNHLPLQKKYKSANFTIRNWWKRQKPTAQMPTVGTVGVGLFQPRTDDYSN